MRNESGRIDPLVIPLVISIFIIVGLAGFGLWSYVNFLDQRDNVDQKITEAVAEAEAAQAETLEADFAEREKAPNVTYVGPGELGSVSITYPRTWSAFIDESGGSSKPLHSIFHPRFVPEDDSVAYALQFDVLQQDFDRAIKKLSDEAEDGAVAAKPLTLEGQRAIRFDGQIDRDYRGAALFFELRDKTIKIWTESESYLGDFNNIVVKNLTFEP